MLRLLQQISLRQLRPLWGRVILVVAGVAVGTTLIVAVDVVNESVLDSFQRTMRLVAGPADLQVKLGLGEVGFSESVTDLVRGGPDVVAAVPLIRGTVTLAAKTDEVLHVFGADLAAEEDLGRYRTRLTSERRDAAMALIDIRSIFVSEALAKRVGRDVGDPLRLSTPHGLVTVTIRGLLEPHGLARAYSGNVAVMDIAAAQWLLDKDGRIDQIDIVVRDGADVGAVAAGLRRLLPDELRVTSPDFQGADYRRVLSSFQAMLTGLSLLCLVTGIYVIYNTTTTAAIQRTKTMAQLRLIGAKRTVLFRLLIIEALCLGSIGSVLGVLIGLPLAWVLAGTITGSMGVIFQLRFPIDAISINGLRLAVIVLLGMTTAVFASTFAAHRMAALDPLDQLRGGLASTPPAPSAAQMTLWWLLLLSISVGAFALEESYQSIAWGNFGSTLWNASVIVIATPIVGWLARPVSRILARYWGAAGQVAAGTIFRSAIRTGVTTAAIALIVTIATILSSLVLSSRESLRSYFQGVLAADLTVSAVSTEGGWLETPLPRALAAELANVDGVAGVETARGLSGHLYKGTRIGLVGLSAGLFDPARTPSGWYREGQVGSATSSLRDGTGVAISTSLSDRFELHIGDRIDLNSPSGMVSMPIVGVVPDYLSDRGSVILHRAVLSERWGDDSVNRFLVSVAPGHRLERVRQSIVEALGARFRLKILDLQELLEYHTQLIDRAFAVMNSVQLLIVIVTIAGILDLLVSRVVERRREIGLWRVVGAKSRVLRRSVLLEAGTIGLMGAALGLVTGFVTSWIWIRVHFRQLLGYYIEFHFALSSAVWYVVLVMLMTAVAGFAAARYATRQPVLGAIRNE